LIYVYGDIHLRESNSKLNINWEYNDQRITEVFKARKPEERETSIAVFTGDIFEKTSHKGRTNRYALRLINAARLLFRQIIIVTGNHEISIHSGNNLDIFKDFTGVTIIEKPTELHIDGFKTLLCPHIDGLSMKAYQELIKNGEIENYGGYLEYQLVFGHHFFKENAIMKSPYLDLDEIGVIYTHWIMGHCHKFERISEKKWSTGSWWPCNKGEADYDFNYLAIDVEGIHPIPIKEEYFSSFQFIDWSKRNDYVHDPHSFVVVKVSCKKAEKLALEKDIRAAYPGQLYEIEWEIEEEIKEETVIVESDDDLVGLFFKEEKVSEAVHDLCMSYCQGAE